MKDIMLVGFAIENAKQASSLSTQWRVTLLVMNKIRRW